MDYRGGNNLDAATGALLKWPGGCWLSHMLADGTYAHLILRTIIPLRVGECFVSESILTLLARSLIKKMTKYSCPKYFFSHIERKGWSDSQCRVHRLISLNTYLVNGDETVSAGFSLWVTVKCPSPCSDRPVMEITCIEALKSGIRDLQCQRPSRQPFSGTKPSDSLPPQKALLCAAATHSKMHTSDPFTRKIHNFFRVRRVQIGKKFYLAHGRPKV